MWTVVVILLALWALGMVSSYTLGGVIHIALVAALVLAVVQLASGNKSLRA